MYQEVEDIGQVWLSARWVLNNKSMAEDIKKNERRVKARLVCRGFEKTIEVQSDSPTDNSNNIKNAYLQCE